MTKCSFYVLGLMSVLFCLSSCSKDKQGQAEADNRIAFEASDKAETRSVVNGTFPSGSAFGVWGYFATPDDNASGWLLKNLFSGITNDGVNSITDGNTVTLQNDGLTWSYQGVKYWIPGMNHFFCALYPATQEAVSFSYTPFTEDGATYVSDFELNIDNFDCSGTGDGAVDLMISLYSHYKGPQSDNKVKLDFKHELSKVNVIAKSEGADVTVTSSKIYNVCKQAAFKANGVTTISDAGTISSHEWKSVTWTEQSDASDTDNIFAGQETVVKSGSDEIDLIPQMLMIPQDLPYDGTTPDVEPVLELSYKYGSESGEIVKIIKLGEITPAGSDGTRKWEAGKQYNYKITFKTGTIQLYVSVNDWNGTDTSVSWE